MKRGFFVSSLVMGIRVHRVVSIKSKDLTTVERRRLKFLGQLKAYDAAFEKVEQRAVHPFNGAVEALHHNTWLLAWAPHH